MQMVRGKIMTQVDMVQVDELVREIARALVDEPGSVEPVLNLRQNNLTAGYKLSASSSPTAHAHH